MKALSILLIFVYSFNTNSIFGREIGLTDWQFWVPIGMMLVGWLEGYCENKK